ncbi:MAG: MFS transporter, partial [Pseudomonadota bacterium]|nr:MFS transporter [Pseudomonadota bacterium]
AGLGAIAAGCVALSTIPAAFGLPGYVAPIIVITVGYALFQTANNSAVMADIRPDQRGVIGGMLNLSRNLGLVTGASVMGSVYAAAGMRTTFCLAAIMIGVALGIALRTRAAARPPHLSD